MTPVPRTATWSPLAAFVPMFLIRMIVEMILLSRTIRGACVRVYVYGTDQRQSTCGSQAPSRTAPSRRLPSDP